MNFISSLLPGSVPSKNVILEAKHVHRPSPVKAWWRDDGGTEMATPRDDRSFDFGPIGHYMVHNVTVIPDALAFTEDGMLLDHSIRLSAYRKKSKLPKVAQIWQSQIDEFRASGEAPKRISEPTMMGVSQGGKRVWGHWIAQNLPKCLFFLENFPSGKIAVPASYFRKHANFGDSLLRAGCPRDRLILMARSKPYLFENLIVLDYLYGPHIIHPDGIRLLAGASDHIAQSPDYNESRIPPTKRIFVPRSMKGSRAIANGPEIEEMARSFGFSVIPLGTYNVAEQVKAWREAEAIVTVCGSDLTNMVFAKGPLRVGSLTPVWFKDIFFADLTSAKGFEWYELFCSVTPDEGTHSSRSVYVNPDYARTFFEAMTA